MIWLWASLAGASPLSDLVDRVPGEPLVVLSCDRASRVLDARAGPAFGLDALGPLAEGDQRVFDMDAPILMALTADAQGMRLAIDARVTDPDNVAERLETLAVDGVESTLHGDRLEMVVPQGPGGETKHVPLVERADTYQGPGCVFVVSAPAMWEGIPVLNQATWIEVTFEDPDDSQNLTIDLPSPPPAVAAVLDGEGDPGIASVRSTQRFDVVLQVHGTFEEMLGVLPLVTGPDNALFLRQMADGIPRAVRGVPGIQVALGGPETGGALVIPMKRPRSRRRLLKAARRIGEAVELAAEPLGNDVLRLTPEGRPPLHVGARRGLLVVALREDVVRDVLSDEGEPWFPHATGPYGLRMRTAPGAPPLLEGLDGYMELRYADGALHATVWPSPAE